MTYISIYISTSVYIAYKIRSVCSVTILFYLKFIQNDSNFIHLKQSPSYVAKVKEPFAKLCLHKSIVQLCPAKGKRYKEGKRVSVLKYCYLP